MCNKTLKNLQAPSVTIRRKTVRTTVAMAIVLVTSLVSQLSLKAAIEVTPTLAGGGSYSVGDPITVNIVVSGLTEHVYSTQFRIAWDESVLTFVPASSTPGAGFDFYFFTQDPDAPSSAMRASLTSSAGSSASTLCTLRFTAGPALGTTTLSFIDDTTPPDTFTQEMELKDSGFVYYPDILWNSSASITVPEPINVALGLFAGAFVSLKSWRWWGRRQTLRRSSSCQ